MHEPRGICPTPSNDPNTFLMLLSGGDVQQQKRCPTLCSEGAEGPQKVARLFQPDCCVSPALAPFFFPTCFGCVLVWCVCVCVFMDVCCWRLFFFYFFSLLLRFFPQKKNTRAKTSKRQRPRVTAREATRIFSSGGFLAHARNMIQYFESFPSRLAQRKFVGPGVGPV